MSEGNTIKQKYRQLLHLLTVIACTLGIFVVLVFFFRIPLIEFIGRAALKTAGVIDAQFVVSRFDATQLLFDRIRLGSDAKAHSITISYYLGNLVQGHLEEIVIKDLDIDLSRLEQGFVGLLRRKIARVEKNTDNEILSAFHLPHVRLVNTRVFRETGPDAVTIILNGADKARAATNARA